MTEKSVEVEAAAFRRLLEHLNIERTDVQNIDLMILAGFCRNCLADWYREAGAERGLTLSKRRSARTRLWRTVPAHGKPNIRKMRHRNSSLRSRSRKRLTANQCAAQSCSRSS